VSRCGGPAVEQTPDVSCAEGATPAVEKDRFARLARLIGGRGESRPAPRQPGHEGVRGRLADGDAALTRSLAPHRDHPVADVEVTVAEATQLGHPQPAAVEQLEDRSIPQTNRLRIGACPDTGLVEHDFELGLAEHPGQATLARRGR